MGSGVSTSSPSHEGSDVNHPMTTVSNRNNSNNDKKSLHSSKQSLSFLESFKYIPVIDKNSHVSSGHVATEDEISDKMKGSGKSNSQSNRNGDGTSTEHNSRKSMREIVTSRLPASLEIDESEHQEMGDARHGPRTPSGHRIKHYCEFCKRSFENDEELTSHCQVCIQIEISISIFAMKRLCSSLKST